MSIKKVVYISPAANISGATLALLEIATEMKKRGIQPVVITASRGPFEKKLQENNIRFYRALYFSWLVYPGELDTLRGKIKWFVKSLLARCSEARISGILKKECPDIVHINTGLSPVGIQSAKALGIPLVWHIREIPEPYFDRSPFDAECERRCLAAADRLLAISESIAAVYKNKSADNITVLYDGVDTSRYAGLVRKPVLCDAPAAELAMCGGNESKGHKDAVTALSILHRRGYTRLNLKLWGNMLPDYKKQLEALIKNLDLEQSVQFCGFTDDMPKAWAEADVTLMCSRAEAFGRATVEAMAAGTLVIGADSGATPEIIGKDRGLLYAAGRPEKLADAIEWALQNPECAQTMADAGREYISSGAFSMEKHIKALLEIYSQLADDTEH